MSTMGFLVLLRDILVEVKRIFFRTTNETGVWLVGEIQGRCYIVRRLIVLGERAVHSREFYKCEKEYAEDQFNEQRNSH
jgi:hypothetical protein